MGRLDDSPAVLEPHGGLKVVDSVLGEDDLDAGRVQIKLLGQFSPYAARPPDARRQDLLTRLAWATLGAGLSEDSTADASADLANFLNLLATRGVESSPGMTGATAVLAGAGVHA